MMRVLSRHPFDMEVTAMSLDLAVAHAMYAVRLVERALNERTGWSLGVGDVRVPAVREVRADGVTFRSVLPDVAGGQLSLYHQGELVAARTFEARGSGPYDATFELALGNSVGV